MWVLIDNYDSFTYILHHYLLMTGNDCRVVRNDEISIPELRQLRPERIILSPGPETPKTAGITMDVVSAFHEHTPLLGICLGHQAIGLHFGGRLAHAPYPMHGKTSTIRHVEHRLFDGLPQPFTAMRYHSLCLENLANTGLQTLATAQDDGLIMAIEHQQYPSIGFQFHPESIGTPLGQRLLRNWSNIDYSHFQATTP